MRAFIDAPILVYLNTLVSKEIRAPYEEFYLDSLLKYRVYTDVLVLDELIYVSQKKYGVPYEVSIEFIKSFVMPYITILSIGEEEYNNAVEFMRIGLRPSDALHLGVMRSNGINLIISEDEDFDKVKGVKRIWIGSE
jgi:predicted nucleic acid-binding protein